jgi:hypothetical protein
MIQKMCLLESFFLGNCIKNSIYVQVLNSKYVAQINLSQTMLMSFNQEFELAIIFLHEKDLL